MRFLGRLYLVAMVFALGGCPDEDTKPTQIKYGSIAVTISDADGNETDRIPANGTDYVQLEITVKDKDAKAWSGSLQLSTDRGSFGISSQSASIQVTSDNTGMANAQFSCFDPNTNLPAEPGLSWITIRSTVGVVRASVICEDVIDQRTISLAGPSDTSVHYADGTSDIPVIATLTSSDGSPFGGAAVVFTTADGSSALVDNQSLVASLTEVSDANGEAQIMVRSLANPGTIRVLASWEYNPQQPAKEDDLTLSFAADGSSLLVTTNRSAVPADGSVEAMLTATAMDLSGAPVPDGTEIRLTVNSPYYFSASSDVDVVVETVGGNGQVQTSLASSITLGAATVLAEFSPVDGVTKHADPLQIEFVEPGMLVLIADVVPESIYTDDQESALITVTAERDGAAVGANQEINFDISLQDSALATFGVQGVPDSVTHASSMTDSNGQATASIRGIEVGVAGSVDVVISTVDTQNGNEVVETTETVLLKRHPILQSVVYVGSEPAVLGIRGSRRPSSAVVRFLALDDNSEPMPDVHFLFLPPVTIDPDVVITTAGGGNTSVSNSSGEVVAYLAAGEQAHPVQVVATATDPDHPEIQIIATSEAIPVTSGLTSWVHSYWLCDPKMATLQAGFSESVDTSEDNKPENRADRKCEAVLADRFSERVPLGASVQLRVESGNITPVGTTDINGIATDISYLPGGLPLPTETKDAEGNMGTKNPSDQLVAMLGYTRGEEPFSDINGNGSYDEGEPFVDFPEPYLDKHGNCVRNNGMDPTDEYYVDPALTGGVQDPYLVLTHTDPFIDGDNNGVWSPPNGVWDSDTLIWFQENTLFVGPVAGFDILDVQCADADPSWPDCSIDPRPNPCYPSKRCQRLAAGLPGYLDPGEEITLRFRAWDEYGNCPYPGVDGYYRVGIESDGGDIDSEELRILTIGKEYCGLTTGVFASNTSGHITPYCSTYSNLVVDEKLLVVQDGVGSYPRSIRYNAPLLVGTEVNIGVSFSSAFTSDVSASYVASYVVNCNADEQCGGAPSFCDLETGMCAGPE